MIGLGTGYFFRLAEKTDQSIELLHTAMEEEREVVAHAIAIYELLRHRMRGSLDPAIVDVVLGHRPALRWVGTDTYDMLRPGAGISHGMGTQWRMRSLRRPARLGARRRSARATSLISRSTGGR